MGYGKPLHLLSGGARPSCRSSKSSARAARCSSGKLPGHAGSPNGGARLPGAASPLPPVAAAASPDAGGTVCCRSAPPEPLPAPSPLPFPLLSPLLPPPPSLPPSLLPSLVLADVMSSPSTGMPEATALSAAHASAAGSRSMSTTRCAPASRNVCILNQSCIAALRSVERGFPLTKIRKVQAAHFRKVWK